MGLANVGFSRVTYHVVHRPVVLIGMALFRLFGKTPWFSYWSMRKLYFFEGASFRRRDRLLKSMPATPLTASLFPIEQTQIDEWVAKLKRDGFALLPFELPADKIAYLTDLATKLKPTARVPAGVQAKPLDFAKPEFGRYDFNEQDLRADPVIAKLASDGLFLKLASAYLQAKPVNDLVAMWWNFYQPSVDTKALAQNYHADIDRLRFLKFFFYLTDVSAETGPHCFIRGSHANCPQELRRDKRFSDEQVFQHFKREDEMVFTGPKGMILVEDTLGLHKGLPLKAGRRLMFQLEYSSSLFGQSHY